MAKGECNCGAVAFEIDAEPNGIYVCHCSICRKWSGTHGIAVAIASNDAFRWVRGEEHITRWKKPDADWMSCFCNVCGSPLPGPNDDERMFIPVGLLTEGAEHLQVTDHIWVDSRAPWDVIGDDGRQHKEAYEG
ncbi:MAG: GFA family protein [Pseudomonadota bacterium]